MLRSFLIIAESQSVFCIIILILISDVQWFASLYDPENSVRRASGPGDDDI